MHIRINEILLPICIHNIYYVDVGPERLNLTGFRVKMYGEDPEVRGLSFVDFIRTSELKVSALYL